MSKLETKCTSCGVTFIRRNNRQCKLCSKCTGKIDKQLRKKAKKYIDDYKENNKCFICSEDNPSVLDLHHIDPNEKEIGLSRAIASKWSNKRIDKELAKCVVLCANHHRLVHAGKLNLVI